MSSAYDEKIEDVLVDSELARRLVPNKFKFTSQQGRLRRQQLLAAAKELSATRPVSEISLADVCERADIPRASAYHFFPNVEAIFLALRFLNAIEIFNKLEKVDAKQFSRWQAYITTVIETGVDIIQSDLTVARLIYETNTPDFEGNAFGSEIEKSLAQMVYDKLSEHYKMPALETIHQQLLVAYGIINGIFILAYRSEKEITDTYRQEAITAVIAYLRCYLPENLPKNG